MRATCRRAFTPGCSAQFLDDQEKFYALRPDRPDPDVGNHGNNLTTQVVEKLSELPPVRPHPDIKILPRPGHRAGAVRYGVNGGERLPLAGQPTVREGLRSLQ